MVGRKKNSYCKTKKVENIILFNSVPKPHNCSAFFNKKIMPF